MRPFILGSLILLVHILTLFYVHFQFSNDDHHRTLSHSTNSAHSGLSVQQEAPQLAIVVPFVASQASRIVHNWENSWIQFAPCDVTNGAVEAVLILYLDEEWNESLKKSILHYWESFPYRHCFKHGLQLITLQGPFAGQKLSHFDGACIMFWEIFDQLEAPTEPQNKRDFFLWMEPDVQPMQKNWLSQLWANEFENGEWWIRGSAPYCSSEYGELKHRKDLHLNGNALYRLHQPEFTAFRERIQQRYPAGITRETQLAAGCATGAVYELGFDHTMYQFRQDPQNFEYSRQILSKFVYTNAIRNYCQNTPPPNLPRSVLLVHSGWNFKRPSERMVLDVFHEVFNYYGATEREVKFYESKIVLGEIKTRVELIGRICEQDHLWHIKREACRDGAKARPHFQSPQWWSKQFPHEYYVWTSDLHAGPIMGNADMFREMGMVVHAEIDFPNCVYYGVCKDRLQVLSYNNWRGFSLDDPDPETMKAEFQDHYSQDPEMQRVDIVIASHPAANIELYMSLNKSMIVYFTTRANFGRHDELIDWRQPIIAAASAGQKPQERWEEWIKNLQLIAASPERNLIAANNLYDKHYVEYYFPGVQVAYLPSLCTNEEQKIARYVPSRSEFLIGPSRDNLDLGPRCYEWSCNAHQHPLFFQLQEALSQAHLPPAVRIRELYPSFHLQDLYNHRAVIVFPYQASIMTVIEMYRSNIPMFAPTQRFLLEWNSKYDFLFERIYGQPPIPKGHETSVGPDSNDPAAIKEWIQWFDIYQWKSVILFDSFEQLAEQLHSTDFQQIHDNMAKENEINRVFILHEWRKALSKLNLSR